MSLFMDVHTIEDGVTEADVAEAHKADLETQSKYQVRFRLGASRECDGSEGVALGCQIPAFRLLHAEENRIQSLVLRETSPEHPNFSQFVPL